MTNAPYKDRLDYIRRLFAPESEALARARMEAADGIQIYAEEGKLLQLLARMIDARKIVEIGTLNGYSTLWLAGGIAADGRIWTLEKDPQRANSARKNLPPAATLIEGDAAQTLAGIESEGPFDMVFIDADKIGYARYLDWAEANVRKGGLIIGDNTFLFDAVWNDAPIDRVRETARHAMRDFNKRLADPQKYLGVMLPTPEGLTVALKLF